MNETKSIAVDFDGVLFDHVPYMLRGFRDAYGIDLAAEGLRHWDLFHYRAVQDAGLTHRCVRRVLDAIENDPVLHQEPPRDRHAAGVMADWQAQGHKVSVVTARMERSRPVIEEFLKVNGIPHDALVLQAGLKTGYDVLVDDAPHNVLMAAADGSRALLMDHPYNRDVPTHTNPRRVYDWHDVQKATEGFLEPVRIPAVAEVRVSRRSLEA